jgi:hypothetical protein
VLHDRYAWGFHASIETLNNIISLDDEGGGRRQPWGDKSEEGVRSFISLLPSIQGHGWKSRRLGSDLTEKERKLTTLISGSPRDRLFPRRG